MTSEINAVNRQGRNFADPAFEKSAYIVFAEFCSTTMIQLSEINGPVRAIRRSVSIFHLSEREAPSLARAMGVEPRHWDRARGVDLRSWRSVRRVFLDHLRYCPACLALGHQSTLFQLTQVLRCPIHIERLRTGCPYCGRPISTGLSDVARNHLYCGACGHHLAAERSRVSPESHPAAQLFEPLRRAISPRASAIEIRSDLTWDKSPAEVVANPTLTRLHHIHSTWGGVENRKDCLKVKTEVFLLKVEHGIENRPLFAGECFACTTAFRDLALLAERYAALGNVPRGLLGEGRLDEQVSAVTAAFWQTAWCLGVSGRTTINTAVMVFLGGQYPAWLPEHVEAKTYRERPVRPS